MNSTVDAPASKRIHGFPAHIDQSSVVLILGTLPGRASLASGKYYADPSNKFWDILFMACGEKAEKSDEAKELLLRKYHIALWDILDSAARDTSSDKDLMDERPNDLPRCLAEYPNIQLLLFHSKDACQYFKRFFKNPAVPYICVSSPSGQNRKSTEEKAKEWKAALSCVIPQLRGKDRLTWKGPVSLWDNACIIKAERSLGMKEKIISGIFGLCIADAVGVPFEFRSRESLAHAPATDMCGYGTYNQPPGTWSDDTTMTLCLLDSLSGGLDYTDIMERFLSWLEDAEYTPHHEVFDAGRTSREAVLRFAKGVPPLRCGGASEHDNGNGSLMRILPLVFYLHSRFGEDFFENEEAVAIIHNVSALTHAHKRSQIACGIYLSIAGRLLGGTQPKDAFALGVDRAWKYYSEHTEYAGELEHYERIHASDFAATPENQIKSGGYVVDTLESALWCLLNTDNYETCILKAVNLGEDTDTTAAVAGGLAGMYYGYDSIPRRWREKIAKAEYIAGLCTTFYSSLNGSVYSAK